ncbi:MAG: hypothetical protein LBQ61_10565 [Spirochaetales bacterium]|jgi:hypothetical protein|nr:hypothetical protein [Spirochaetales bacterium]
MKKFRFLPLALLLAACAAVPPPAEPVEQTPPPPPPAVEPQIPAPEPVNEGDSGEFQVDAVLFQETLEDIQALILNLNEIIKGRNYDIWLTHLTSAYVEHYSSPTVLREVSQEPTLRSYNIRLRSLADYFQYVVVPSRSEARVDDLIFLDENHIQAIMNIDEIPRLLYSLEKIDDAWKIGI